MTSTAADADPLSRAGPHGTTDNRGHPSFVWCFAGFLVANMFSGYTAGLPLPIGPDRLLLAASVGLFVLDRRYSVTVLRTFRFRAVHLACLSVVVVTLLSALAAHTLTTSIGFFALLDRLVVPYAVFAFAPLAFRRPADRLLLLKVLTLMGVYLGVTAFGEIIGPRALVWPRYILDPSVGIQFGRARGPFGEAEADGIVMAACLWCGVVVARLRLNTRWTAIGYACAGATAVGGLLTLTRSVWLGIVLGGLAVAAIDRRYRKSVIRVAAAAIVLGALTVIALPTLRTAVSDRATNARTVDDRRNTNAAAVRGIEAHPLFGIGWQRFLPESDHYVRQSPEYALTTTQIEVHNVVLSRAVELGIPGAALWLTALALGPGAVLVRRKTTEALQTWRVILTGSFACWGAAVLFSPVPYPLPNTLIWLFAGLAVAATQDLQGDTASHARPSTDTTARLQDTTAKA